METLIRKIITISIIIIIIMLLFSGISYWLYSTEVKIDGQPISRVDNESLNQINFIDPDEIIIYQNGNSQTINKDDDLYKDIVSEINKRADGYIDIVKLAFDKKSMETIKQREVVIEFVYIKSYKLEFTYTDKEYYGLIFPLTGENAELCFFENNSDSYSGPIGFLNNSDSLLDLLIE